MEKEDFPVTTNGDTLHAQILWSSTQRRHDAARRAYRERRQELEEEHPSVDELTNEHWARGLHGEPSLPETESSPSDDAQTPSYFPESRWETVRLMKGLGLSRVERRDVLESVGWAAGEHIASLIDGSYTVARPAPAREWTSGERRTTDFTAQPLLCDEAGYNLTAALEAYVGACRGEDDLPSRLMAYAFLISDDLERDPVELSLEGLGGEMGEGYFLGGMREAFLSETSAAEPGSDDLESDAWIPEQPSWSHSARRTGF